VSTSNTDKEDLSVLKIKNNKEVLTGPMYF